MSTADVLRQSLDEDFASSYYSVAFKRDNTKNGLWVALDNYLHGGARPSETLLGTNHYARARVLEEDARRSLFGPPPPPPPPPPPANVIFQVDYNTQDFTVWDDVAMLDASKSLVPDPAGSGVRVARLQVGPSGGSCYCEPVRLRNNGLDLGLTVTVEQELYVAPGSVWTPSTSWNNLHQTKIQSPDLYGGGLAVYPTSYADGPHFVYKVRNTGSNNDPDVADIDCGPVVTGRWIRFSWTAKWSVGADGFLAVTRDGVALPVYRGATTTSLGSPSGQDGKGVWRKLTQGLYCGPLLSAAQTVYFKGLKVTA